MNLCICAVSPDLSLLNYINFEVYLASEGSDESVHIGSLARAFVTRLHKICGIVGQRS